MQIDEKALQEKLEKSTQLVKSQISEIDALIIVDQETYDMVERLDKQALQAQKEIEGFRHFLVDDITAWVKKVNGFFKPFTDQIDTGREKLRGKRRDYLKDMEEKRLAEERRLAMERQANEEAARLEKINAIFEAAMQGVEYRVEGAVAEKFRAVVEGLKVRADLDGANLGSTIRETAIDFFELNGVPYMIPMDPAELAEADRKVVEIQAEAAAPVAQVVPMQAPPAVQPKDKRGLADRWRFRYVDENGLPVNAPRIDLIPKDFLVPDEKRLGVEARTWKGARKYSGIEFYAE